MTAKSTRILKEARPLVWAWLAVAVGGVLPLAHSQYTIPISLVGFVLGIPLLATLAFGNEFQSRTFSLVLSQPVSRQEIWREKLIVTIFAVVTAMLVFSLTSSVGINHRSPHFFVFISAWTLAVVASGTFWTLWTRSTVGGAALNFGVLALIITWENVTAHLYDFFPYSVEVNSAAILKIALILLCYASVMLWLGWRRLAGFQATGGMAGDDLMTAGPEVMPRMLADLFRSRSSGAILNLVRKEFLLLRPVWLLTILTTLGWSALTTFQVLREHRHVKYLPMTAGATGLAGGLLLAVLAGCMSLGEERASGCHAWHLTLPVSARVQWLVKFLTALVAGVICASVVPLLLLAAGRKLLGLNLLVDHPDYPTIWFWSMLTITAAAFWCSCATDGTVTAALWVVPVLWAIGFAPYAGFWLAERFVPLLNSTFNLYGNLRLDVYLYRCVDGGPHAWHGGLLQSGLRGLMLVPTSYMHRWGSERFVAWIPVAILGILQSYRMFKKQAIAGTKVVLRRLLPLVVLTLAISFSLVATWQFAFGAASHLGSPMWFAYRGIGSFLAESDNVVAGQPVEVTLDELNKANLDNQFFLPKTAIELLHNSRVSVVPESPSEENYRRKGNGPPRPGWFYHATVHLENGADLLISYTDGQPRPRTKISIHLPGAAEDDVLWDW